MKRRKPIGLWPAIGIMIDQKQIAMCITAATAKGRRKIAEEIHDCDEHDHEAILGRLIERFVGPSGAKRRKPGPWVRVGVSEARVFQAALAVTPSNQQNTAQNFFLEAVQATNVRAEDRIVEMVKLDLGGRPLACVAASPRGPVESLIAMISRIGGRIGLLEPGPSALYRAGGYHRRAPRGSKLCVRFFLGKHQAIGVIGAGPWPLFWHTFDLVPGEETGAIKAAYSTLWMMGRQARITIPIDTVIIHGRPELALAQQSEEFRAAAPGSAGLPCAARFPVTTCRRPHWDWRWPIPWPIKPASTCRAPSSLRFPLPTSSRTASWLCTVCSWARFRCSRSGRRPNQITGSSAVVGGLNAFAWLKNQDQPKLRR